MDLKQTWNKLPGWAKGLIGIGVAGVFVWGGYKIYQKIKIAGEKNKTDFKDKGSAAQFIVSRGYYGGDVNTLLGFDDAFVIAWANAVQNGDAEFKYKEKTYNTNGGKQKMIK